MSQRKDQRRFRAFTEFKVNKNTSIREFDVNAPEFIYEWHVDQEDRLIKYISGAGWKFQIDDELPGLLEDSKVIFIRKGVYHRLIKGIDNLTLKIHKL